MTARDRHLPTFKGALKRRILTYGQNTSQNVSYMTIWDETVLAIMLRILWHSLKSVVCCCAFQRAIIAHFLLATAMFCKAKWVLLTSEFHSISLHDSLFRSFGTNHLEHLSIILPDASFCPSVSLSITPNE